MIKLSDEISSPLPPGAAALSADEADDLANLVATAKRNHADACDKAIDDGLAFLPRLVRVAVKKALFA